LLPKTPKPRLKFKLLINVGILQTGDLFTFA